MTNADKMFEELGYKKTAEFKSSIYYELQTPACFHKIVFVIDNKTVYKDNSIITMQELKAINKKCEEMGWLEE